jgi:hypothetical protein
MSENGLGIGSALMICSEPLISEDVAEGRLESLSSELSILALPLRIGDVEWLLRDLSQP